MKLRTILRFIISERELTAWKQSQFNNQFDRLIKYIQVQQRMLNWACRWVPRTVKKHRTPQCRLHYKRILFSKVLSEAKVKVGYNSRKCIFIRISLLLNAYYSRKTFVIDAAFIATMALDFEGNGLLKSPHMETALSWMKQTL